MKKVLQLLFVLILSACGVKKKAPNTASSSNHNSSPAAFSLAENIVATAQTYDGTPYKYAGTTRKGMDCSGLVYTAFKTHGQNLPRASYLMAEKGVKITLNEVKKGDLLFFKTSKNRNRISHVGLVVSNGGEPIRFIHATTSRGVLVSSLSENYWMNAFTEARSIMK